MKEYELSILVVYLGEVAILGDTKIKAKLVAERKK
jgi:hypothetical protein